MVTVTEQFPSTEQPTPENLIPNFELEKLDPEEFFVPGVVRSHFELGLPAIVVSAGLSHHQVAKQIERDMNGDETKRRHRGWRRGFEGSPIYNSESSPHLDGTVVNPYIQVHTTLSAQDGDTERIGSRFTIYSFLPSEAQHQALRGHFGGMPPESTNVNEPYALEFLQAKIAKLAGERMIPIATFSFTALPGETAGFINGYNASANYDDRLMTFHYVYSIDPETANRVGVGRRAQLSVVEPIKAEAKQTSPLNIFRSPLPAEFTSED